MFGISVPTFWLAVVLVIFFAVNLNWLPATGMGSSGSDTFNYFDWDDFKFAVMPIIALALPPLGIMTRTTRSALSEILNQDFIQTLRAKGLSEFSIITHAVRNIMPGAIAMLGLQLGYLIGGSVLVETVFTWPGTGLPAQQGDPHPRHPAAAGHHPGARHGVRPHQSRRRSDAVARRSAHQAHLRRLP